MSTKERYGTAVWDAVLAHCLADKNTVGRLMSVGDVARWAKVSRGTAKKYLMELVRLGCLATFPIGNRWVFQFLREGCD